MALRLVGNRRASLTTTKSPDLQLPLRRLSSTTPTTPPPPAAADDRRLSETATLVCDAVRRQPRWESSLLSQFPASDILHPTCSALVLRRLSSSNLLLSLRYFLFLSTHRPTTNISPLLPALARAGAYRPALHALRSTKCPADSTALDSFLRLLFHHSAPDTISDALAALPEFSGFSPSIPTWNAALSGALRAGRTDLVWHAYQLMIQSSTAVDAATAGHLIYAFCSENRLSEAHEFLVKVTKNGVVPDAAAIYKLISGFCREDNLGKVSELLRLMISAGRNRRASRLSVTATLVCDAVRRQPQWESSLLSQFPPSDILHPTCTALVLRRLSSSSSSSSSNPLLFQRYLLFLSTHRPTTTIYSLLPTLAHARAYRPALHALRSTKCPTDPPALDSFLRLLFRHSTPDTISDALAALPKFSGFSPSVPTWNAALSGALRAGRTDLVWRAYQLMIQYSTAGDAATAGHLIHAFCRENRLPEAHELLLEVAKNGVVPDVAAITKLISGFCREANFGKVSELLHLMISVGRPPDIVTYQIIIHGLCNHGRGDEGFRVFSDLKLRGYPLDLVTYTTMIDGMCKMGRMDDALKLWSEMLAKGMKPNQYTYNAIVDGYCKVGDLDHARKVYDDMLKRGYKESTVSCSIMIAGLCLKGEMREAMEMFEEMPKKGIARDMITYNTLIRGFCKCRNSAEAMDLYRGLLEMGAQPDVHTFKLLIQALCEEGNVLDAAELMKSMEDRGLEPLVSSNDSIITGLCNAGNLEEAMAWLAKMLEKNLNPRLETFNRVVESLSLIGRVDDALLVLNTMLESGYSLGTSVSNGLIDQLCKESQPQAQRILEDILISN